MIHRPTEVSTCPSLPSVALHKAKISPLDTVYTPQKVAADPVGFPSEDRIPTGCLAYIADNTFDPVADLLLVLTFQISLGTKYRL